MQHRKENRWCSTIIVAIFLGTSSAKALDFDGSALYQICSDHNPNSAANVACNYYVRGIIEGMLMGTLTERNAKGTYCPPDGLSQIQGRLIVEKYMRDNPLALSQQPAGIILDALLASFPCKRSN